MKGGRFIRWLALSRAILRVTAYGVFAFSIAALLAARVLYADVKEAALSMGRELAQVSDLLNGAETILVNGEEMHHASSYVEQDLSTVLDRFEAYCSASPSFVGRAMRDLPKDLAAKVEKEMPNRASKLGIVRQESRGSGMVACFADDRPAGLHDFKERLERFLVTMRLSEFGHFGYFYAEQKRGARTHVVATWADTGLDIRAMFPSEGDAAGADSRVLPRPPNARRTLSAATKGGPYGLFVYTSGDRADAVNAFYDRFLKSGHFEPVPAAEDTKQGTSAFLRDDGYQVFISVAEIDRQTFVTLTEAGSTEHPNVAGVQVTSE